MTSRVKTEIESLYSKGFALHLLKPRSKAPLKSKWTTGPRESKESLLKALKPGLNLGVRLGTPSRVGEGYLAVIDIDVKGEEKRFEEEAITIVRELFPDLFLRTPENPGPAMVRSGRGNGSCHLYVITATPAVPQKLAVSSEKVKVFMPSAPVSRASKEALSEEDLNEGYRIRPAWEVSLMGEGQQVVLPPSVHPDSGKEYRWLGRPTFELPLLPIEGKLKKSEREKISDFEPVLVDLDLSTLSEATKEVIRSGEADDRSVALFKIVIEMVKSGWKDIEILSVLTDTEFGLSQCCYDHAKTESRKRAADWLYNYTIKKVRRENDASIVFDKEVEVSEISEEEAKEQEAELFARDWRLQIDRNGPKGNNPNSPKLSFKNVLLILQNEAGSDIFRRDVFSYRDFYTYDSPWGGEKGATLTDSDPILIKNWLSQRYRFEPSVSLIEEVIVFITEKNTFDPVREKLESLPEWDGVNRLDGWLGKNFEAEGEPEYLAQVFRKWMVAMITRIYRPGAKFDWMPIFEGAQGVGKSSFGRMLAGEDYFLDWLPVLSDKDAALGLQGAWVVEMGELASLRKNEIEIVKAFITRQIDKVRPPYGKRSIESERRCVFFGTTNQETYLKDDTGNRRFKPVKVGSLNFTALRKEREQLFAEALFIYKNDLEITLELEDEAREFEKVIHAEKTVEDDSEIMKELLMEFIEKEKKKGPKERFNFSRFSLRVLFSPTGGPLSDFEMRDRNLKLAGKAIRDLGGKRWKSRGLKVWGLGTA